MGQILAAIPVMGQILIAMGQWIIIPKVEVRLLLWTSHDDRWPM